MTDDKFEYTETFRLEQAGMGYLQFHAAVTWFREWLAHNKVVYKELGAAQGVSPIQWEVEHETGTFWLSFDLQSLGHLLYSSNHIKWEGTDATYHAATGTAGTQLWEHVLRRVLRMRRG